MSDDEARPTPSGGETAPAPGDATAPPAPPEVMDGIRSLHERLDELQRLVAERLDTEDVRTAGEWLHARADTAVHAARAVPAWQRRTQGELRWPVTLTTRGRPSRCRWPCPTGWCWSAPSGCCPRCRGC